MLHFQSSSHLWLEKAAEDGPPGLIPWIYVGDPERVQGSWLWTGLVLAINVILG